jgi:hypothetical protein
MSDKRAFTQVEAIRYLGVSDRSLRNEVAKGNMPVRFYGTKKLYDRADLDAFFAALPAEATRA